MTDGEILRTLIAEISATIKAMERVHERILQNGEHPFRREAEYQAELAAYQNVLAWIKTHQG